MWARQKAWLHFFPAVQTPLCGAGAPTSLRRSLSSAVTLFSTASPSRDKSFSLRHRWPPASSRGRGQIRRGSFVGRKLISFLPLWLNHKAARNESPPSLFHYSLRRRYRALNIASLYIPFYQIKKKEGIFWTSGVYYVIPGADVCLLSLFLSLSLCLLDLWATSSTFQLQMREGLFATLNWK